MRAGLKLLIKAHLHSHHIRPTGIRLHRLLMSLCRAKPHVLHEVDPTEVDCRNVPENQRDVAAHEAPL